LPQEEVARNQRPVLDHFLRSHLPSRVLNDCAHPWVLYEQGVPNNMTQPGTSARMLLTASQSPTSILLLTIDIMAYSSKPWGYVIYRTTYTPESDSLWPRAINTINTYVAHFTLETLTEQNKESLYEEMISRLENIPIQDPALDGATYEDLRLHFATWLRTQDRRGEPGDRDLPLARSRTFLVIDQAALEKIANAPNPTDDGVDPRAVSRPCLIAVAAQHQEGRRLRPTRSARGPRNANEGKLFPGWMRVPIFTLHELWEANSERLDIIELCPSDFVDEPVWEP
jgi:hypothetical protein